MINKCLFVSLALLGQGLVFGQKLGDTLYLNTVDVFDSIITQDQHIKSFEFDSVMYSYTSAEHAGEFLQNNTSMFIKDKGPGASSSMSFRGNGASHTKVYWEGISIDNAMLGQSDVSLFQTSRYLGLEFIKGGNSLDLGSGGFGGILNFKPGTESWNEQQVEFGIEAGSFGSRSTELNLIYGNGKIKFESFWIAGLAKNDFPYLNYLSTSEIELRENASTENVQWLSKFSWRLNSKNELSIGTWLTETNRQVPSAIGTAHGEARQKDSWRKLMANWQYSSNSFSMVLRSAIMDDRLNYYNSDQGISSYNRVKSWKNLMTITKHFSKKVSNEIQVKGDVYEVLTNNYARIIEDYNIGLNEALIYSLKKGHIRAGVRADKWRNTDIAFMPSLYAFASPLNSIEDLGVFADISYNVRFPSFNDKYWLDLGNTELNPEKARSTELGLQYRSDEKRLFQYSSKLTFFHSEVKDLIIWMPDDNAIWRPENEDELSNKGFDLEATLALLTNNWVMKGIVNYAYTSSIPGRKDDELKQQIYVPKHKMSYSLHVSKRTYFMNYEQAITSEVYIYADNSAYLPSAFPANLEFGKTVQLRNSALVLSAGVLNLFNESYQYVAHMPMPLRNYRLSIYININ